MGLELTKEQVMSHKAFTLEDVMKLIDEVEDLKRANAWQPIDTAPMGQNIYGIAERVLLWVPPYGPSTGHYDDGWHCHSVLNKKAQPTHWKPLRDEPEE